MRIGISDKGWSRISESIKAQESEFEYLMEILRSPNVSLVAVDGLEEALSGDPLDEMVAILVFDTPDETVEDEYNFIHKNVLSIGKSEQEGLQRGFDTLEKKVDSDPRSFDYDVFHVTPAELDAVADEIMSLAKAAKRAQESNRVFELVDAIGEEVGGDVLIGELVGILVEHVDRKLLEQELMIVANMYNIDIAKEEDF